MELSRDPRTGRLLRGAAVLRYLTSGLGSLGLVRCEKGALDWSDSTDDFLYSDEDRESGNRFFIGKLLLDLNAPNTSILTPPP